jgi:hypothetical protein
LLDLVNTPDDQLDVAVTTARDAARQREADRDALAQFPNAMEDLKKLGWLSSGFSAQAKALDDRPGQLLKALRGNIPNPAVEAERQDLIKKLGGVNAIDPEVLSQPLALCVEELKRQCNTASIDQARRQVENAGYDFIDRLNNKDRRGVIRCMQHYLDNDGAGALRQAGLNPDAMQPTERAQAYLRHRADALGANNPAVIKAIKNVCPDAFKVWKEVPLVDRLTILERWEEFNRLGGAAELLRLGGDCNPEVGLDSKIEEIEQLQGLERAQVQLDKIDDRESVEQCLRNLFNELAEYINRLPDDQPRTDLQNEYQTADGHYSNARFDEARRVLDSAIERGRQELKRLAGG